MSNPSPDHDHPEGLKCKRCGKPALDPSRICIADINSELYCLDCGLDFSVEKSQAISGNKSINV